MSYSQYYQQQAVQYQSKDDYLRSYGGKVEVNPAVDDASETIKEPTLGESGIVQIVFSRPIIFPTEVLAPYDVKYVEEVPLLELSDDQKKDIDKLYDKYVFDIETRAAEAIASAEAAVAQCKAMQYSDDDDDKGDSDDQEEGE